MEPLGSGGKAVGRRGVQGEGPTTRRPLGTNWGSSPQSDRPPRATGPLTDSGTGTGGINVYVTATGVAPETTSVPLAGVGAYPLVVATE
jgi:hypothetical protein